jgi:beta-phosphoglucomutase
MVKAALFDLDGVVFDTEPLYTQFWGSQFAEFHPNSRGLEHEIKGQTLVQIYDRYFSGQPAIQQLITERLNDFEAQMDYNYIPGFEAFHRGLREQGILTAVVTSSNVPKMEAVYRKHPDFRAGFDAILTSEDFEKSKPAPDGYLKAAQRLGVEPACCIGFEDSFNGLKALRAAGIYTVGLSTTNAEEAIRPLSDLVVADFKDPRIKQLSL